MLEKFRHIRGIRLAVLISLLLTAVVVFTPCFQRSSLSAEGSLPLTGNEPFGSPVFLAVLFLVQMVLLFRDRKGAGYGAAAAGTATLLVMLLTWLAFSLMDELTGSVVYIMPGPAGFRVDISVLGLLALALCMTSVVLEWRLAVKRRS